MSPAKVAVACGLMALVISACGIPPKPVAGTANLRKHRGYYALKDDPRIKHAKCLRADKLPIHQYLTTKQRLPAIQVGTAPGGPLIVFYPTPGAAQALQITGQQEGAEAIGAALLYPNNASNAVLTKVEACTSIGVTG